MRFQTVETRDAPEEAPRTVSCVQDGPEVNIAIRIKRINGEMVLWFDADGEVIVREKALDQMKLGLQILSRFGDKRSII